MSADRQCRRSPSAVVNSLADCRGQGCCFRSAATNTTSTRSRFRAVPQDIEKLVCPCVCWRFSFGWMWPDSAR
jgi:hypothetical protein